MLSNQGIEPNLSDEQIAKMLGISLEEWQARLNDSESLPRERQARQVLLDRLQKLNGQ